MIKISIAKEYTKTPGGRFSTEGQFSGEDFRQSLLKPMYLEALRAGTQLEVNLDGGYGYGSSFLEEAFGGLVRELGTINPDIINIISDEEPQLIEDVKQYISEALNNLAGRR